MENSRTFAGQRIAVIGASGSGKTETARVISRHLDLPHTELDSIHWEPDWVMADREVFLARVRDCIKGDRWVVDGNYTKSRDLIWEKADTVVYLDYPLVFVLGRLLKRSLTRLVTREKLWNDNVESWRDTFFSRDSIIVWSIQTHRKQRKQHPELFSKPEYKHLSVIHLRSHKESMQWLKTLQANT